MEIRVLPERVASQIAAGEVVERPASIAKELIENSLDAGANTIHVDIKDGGVELIRVSDNGHGIPSDELALAFQRHATSKLRRAEDIAAISTLGFRGEALPSIAASTLLTCTTRTVDDVGATRLTCEFGNNTTITACGAPVGTTISAERLFQHMPARRKFLKKRSTEAAHIRRAVERYALCRSEVRFVFTNDGRESFRTAGRGDLKEAALATMGSDTAVQMVPVEHRRGETEVVGLVSATTVHWSNRNEIALFVNGRAIQDRDLAWAVERAYQSALPRGRHPAAALMISMPSEQVDVNAHPTKLEVRFSQPTAVFAAVTDAVADALSKHDIVHKYESHASGRLTLAASARPNLASVRPQQSHSDRDTARSDPGPINPFERPAPRMRPPETNIHHQEPQETLREATEQMRVIGQALMTYIIAESGGNVRIIDQHAAHERVIYDRIRAEAEQNSTPQQQLMIPVIFSPTPEQRSSIETSMELLNQHGFNLNERQDGRWEMTAMPHDLASSQSADAGHIIENMIDEYARESLTGDARHAMAASIACHSAARAGDRLEMAHMQAIVQQLAETANPHTCPHGRPTVISMPARDLERSFHRCG